MIHRLRLAGSVKYARSVLPSSSFPFTLDLTTSWNQTKNIVYHVHGDTNHWLKISAIKWCREFLSFLSQINFYYQVHMIIVNLFYVQICNIGTLSNIHKQVIVFLCIKELSLVITQVNCQKTICNPVGIIHHDLRESME